MGLLPHSSRATRRSLLIRYRFAVNLSNLLDCLGMYGGASSMTAAHMHYPGLDNTLVVALAEGDKVTECSLKTCR